jgi:hypothetical protein
MNIKMLPRFLLRSIKHRKLYFVTCLIVFLFGLSFLNMKENESQVIKEYENDNIKSVRKKNDKNKFDTFFVATKNKTIKKPSNFICPSNEFNKNILKKPLKDFKYRSNQREILVVLSNVNSSEAFLLNLEKIFSFSRIKFRTASNFTIQNFNIPPIVIFESHHDYLSIKDISTFKNYFQMNKIGVIVFSKNNVDDFSTEINECHLNNDPFLINILHITKFNTKPIEMNTTIKVNKDFKNLFYSKSFSKSILKCNTNQKHTSEEILFFDKIDNIQHVFVCIELIDSIWLLKPLFIDSIRYLTNAEIDIGLKRYVQIDIDDVFVSKMYPEDFNDLLSLQDELSHKYFKNNDYKIKFVIGFSGKKYQLANQYENLGDSLFISMWFCFP